MKKIAGCLILLFIAALLSCPNQAISTTGSFADSRPRAWVVSTFAGTGSAGFKEGAAETAQFNYLSGVAVDSSGNVYIADSLNNRIRKITPQGIVSTLAGTGGAGFKDGAAGTAQFRYPYGVAVDSSDNVYVADSLNHRIRMITPQGVVSTIAGDGTTAQFDDPSDVTVDSDGNLYVADRGNHRIRMITPERVISTLAGTGAPGFYEGNGVGAQFYSPRGVTMDAAGHVLVADFENLRIRKITITRSGGGSVTGSVVSTIAGDGTTERFNNPAGVAMDSSGNIYVTDYSGHRIRMITPQGAVSTIAGDGVASHNDGLGTSARFTYPFGVAVDSSGSVYVAEYGGNRVRKIEYKVP